MYNLKKINQNDLENITSIIEFKEVLKDQRLIHYGAYVNDLLVGFILVLNTYECLLITDIYVKKEYQNRGIGHDLLLKIKTEGQNIKKSLCLKFCNLSDKKRQTIIPFFVKEGFSKPIVARRNGIIHLYKLKECFVEKRNFDTQSWLKSIQGEVKIIALNTQNNKEKDILNTIKSIYDFTELTKQNIFNIAIFVFIKKEIGSWIIFHEISSSILNIEFLYTNPSYRKHAIGFSSFTLFIMELLDKFDYKYISFSTVKEDDKLLSYYQYLFGEALIKVVNTEISIFHIDEKV